MKNTSTITSYEEFCMNMLEALKKYYKEEYDVRLQTVSKVNGVKLQGITIIGKDDRIMPTLYLENFYQKYKKGKTFEELLELFLVEYKQAGIKEEFDVQFFSEYEKVKPYLAFKLLNYEMNRELLVTVPHKRYLDLAIVCYCDIRNEKIGHGTILIQNEHLNLWGISKDELISVAMQNMPRLYRLDFINMADVLKQLYNDPVGFLDISAPMFVLTNKERFNGAASLLYKGQLEKIGMFLGRDFYVLPSSIHEVIILPHNKGTDESYLSQMVDEINHEQVAREEILSDHAYRYLCDRKELVSLPLIPYKKDYGN